MSSMELAAVFQSAVALVALAVLLLKLWPSLRLDVFRQEMFSIRDEAFDYAASGKIDFSDPAYRLLRQSFNGFIRYGHHLTCFRLFITVLHWKTMGHPPPIEWSVRWERALANLKDEEVKKDLQQFHTRAMNLVTARLVLGNPFLLGILVITVLAALISQGFRNVADILAIASSDAVARLVDPRLLEEEAARCAA